MTRINTLDPVALTDQHLMAEYRELPMVMASLRRSLASKRGLPAIPPCYTLDRGHVCFFYDKRQWLERRYAALVRELGARGFRLDAGRGAERGFSWIPRSRRGMTGSSQGMTSSLRG